MRKILVFVHLVFVCSSIFAEDVVQHCDEKCVQISINRGSVFIEGRFLQIGVNNGSVNIIGSEEDKRAIQNYEIKVSNLNKKIQNYILQIEQKERRILLDEEKLRQAAEYANSLIKKVDLLTDRITFLDENNNINEQLRKHQFFTSEILLAKADYNFELIKELLLKKQEVGSEGEDGSEDVKSLLKRKQSMLELMVAETAFQLANFQEVDLEYEDAFVNAEKAHILKPKDLFYASYVAELAEKIGRYGLSVNYYEKAIGLYDPKNYEQSEIISLRYKLGKSLLEDGETGRALEILEDSLERARRVFLPCHHSVSGTKNELANVYKKLGRYKDAIALSKEALDCSIEEFGESHALSADQMTIVGTSLHEFGKFREAIGYLEKAFEIRKVIYVEGHPKVSSALNNLGAAWDEFGEHRKGIDYYEMSLKNDIKVLGEKHPKIARSLNNIGMAYSDMGHYEQAASYVHRALEVGKLSYEANHPQLATFQGNLGVIHYHKGELQEAIDKYKKARDIYIAEYGEDSISVAVMVNNIGNVLLESGNPLESIPYFEKTLKFLVDNYGENHQYVAGSYNNLGKAHLDLNKVESARDYFEKALGIYIRIFSEDNEHVAKAKNNLANAMEKLGMNQEALDLLQQAYKTALNTLGESHIVTTTSAKHLARLKAIVKASLSE